MPDTDFATAADGATFEAADDQLKSWLTEQA